MTATVIVAGASGFEAGGRCLSLPWDLWLEHCFLVPIELAKVQLTKFTPQIRVR